MHSKGSQRPPAADLVKCFCTYVSYSEQLRIESYLHQKTAEIDGIESTIAQQITTLAAYRKSLIPECVTGQQRVTEADVRQTGAGDGIPPPRAVHIHQ